MDRLLRIADRYVQRGNPIPLDLAARLMAAGIDVDAIERKAARG